MFDLASRNPDVADAEVAYRHRPAAAHTRQARRPRAWAHSWRAGRRRAPATDR